MANALDRASTACLVAGLIAPLAAFANPLDGAYRFGFGSVLGTVIWISAALALHLMARRILGELRP
nr:hypothetical protein [Rhizobium halophytocola]